MKLNLLLVAIITILSTQLNAQCNAQYSHTLNSNGSITFNATGVGLNTPSTVYLWNFYGSSIPQAYGQSTTVTFTSGGTYTVCLTATDTSSSSMCSINHCDTVMINGPIITCSAMPIAGATVASIAMPNWGDYVSYTIPNSSSGTGITYQWQRAINSTSVFIDMPGETNNFFSENCYTSNCFRCVVTCSATGLSDTSSYVCTTPITPIICSANFTYIIYPNGNVNFYSTASNNTTSTIYSWNLGNGINMNGSGILANYNTAGTYTVCLYVKDTLTNCQDTTCQNVTITYLPCSASYYVYPDTTTGAPPHTYVGINTSTGANNYIWDWGDATPNSTGAYPSHTYANGGSYPICLTVYGTSCTDTFCASQAIFKTSGLNDPYTVNFMAPTYTQNVSKNIITISPNPAFEKIAINGLTSEKYIIEILNLNGTVIKKVNTSNNDVNISIQDLASNIYILKITDKNGIHQFSKLIKQ